MAQYESYDPKRAEAQQQAILATYGNLSSEERAPIDALAKDLKRNVDFRGFGEKTALEVLGALGMLLENEGYPPSE